GELYSFGSIWLHVLFEQMGNCAQHLQCSDSSLNGGRGSRKRGRGWGEGLVAAPTPLFSYPVLCIDTSGATQPYELIFNLLTPFLVQIDRHRRQRSVTSKIN